VSKQLALQNARRRAKPSGDPDMPSRAFMWAYDSIKGWGQDKGNGWKEWDLLDRIENARFLESCAVHIPLKSFPEDKPKKRWKANEVKA
jgi:hypothetical protein